MLSFYSYLGTSPPDGAEVPQRRHTSSEHHGRFMLVCFAGEPPNLHVDPPLGLVDASIIGTLGLSG